MAITITNTIIHIIWNILESELRSPLANKPHHIGHEAININNKPNHIFFRISSSQVRIHKIIKPNIITHSIINIHVNINIE